MQEQGKFKPKINVIPNGVEKYMSFSINTKLNFIDSFQFLNSSLESLVKNFNGVDFKYLSRKFDNNVLDLLDQKGFYPYEYMSDVEKFKKRIAKQRKVL